MQSECFVTTRLKAAAPKFQSSTDAWQYLVVSGPQSQTASDENHSAIRLDVASWPRYRAISTQSSCTSDEASVSRSGAGLSGRGAALIFSNVDLAEGGRRLLHFLLDLVGQQAQTSEGCQIETMRRDKSNVPQDRTKIIVAKHRSHPLVYSMTSVAPRGPQERCSIWSTTAIARAYLSPRGRGDVRWQPNLSSFKRPSGVASILKKSAGRVDDLTKTRGA
jgi:hypothetical protein